MNARLLILTPSLGRVSLGYRDTFAWLVRECALRGIAVMVDDETDPGQLVHVRNVLYARALASDATHALWWDADVEWVINSGFFELLDRPEAMIARAYPMRDFDFEQLAACIAEHAAEPWRAVQSNWLRRNAERWTAQIDFEDGRPVWSADERLVRIASCGFGWVLMKVEAMRDFAKDAATRAKDWRGRPSVCVFDLVSPDGITHGEDTSFCVRWRFASRPIWADPDAKVQNGKFGGRFLEYLRDQGFGPPTRKDPSP